MNFIMCRGKTRFCHKGPRGYLHLVGRYKKGIQPYRDPRRVCKELEQTLIDTGKDQLSIYFDNAEFKILNSTKPYCNMFEGYNPLGIVLSQDDCQCVDPSGAHEYCKSDQSAKSGYCRWGSRRHAYPNHPERILRPACNADWCNSITCEFCYN